jgi:hypothetical protein
MNRLAAETCKILRLLPRATVILAVLSAPVMAVPALQGIPGGTIEAPALKKTGMGFVLLVGLQRD